MSRGDEDRLSARVRRYARVGGAVGGLAARLGAERLLGVKIDRARHAEDLKLALGGIKGPLMKVAQILATIPDALPSEYVQHLSELQSNAPSMGWPFVRRRMQSELGPDWRTKFAEFEQTAARAASLGQVHRAAGHDGRALAVKLQYPDMQSAVEADLRQLRLAFAIFEAYDRAIDTENIFAELSARLREELDYIREAAHLRLYRYMLRTERGVHVPEPVESLSTDRMITMTWLEGEPIKSFISAHKDMRNTVAYNMFRAWYLPFYGYGIIHGDPHLGNYTVRPDGEVNLLDFGCIRVFDPKFVKGVIDLYNALSTDDEELMVSAYRTWGFQNLSKEMLEVLNLWAAYVYAPLMEDRPRRIQEHAGEEMYGAKVAHKVHLELRRLGGVRPPREFVLMDRAAIGLGSVFMHLKAEINWHRLFHDLIADFDPKALARRQQEALAKAKVPKAK
jgi:predicted unusual protein kinase regulating ubiquinone biosynthesis (AarF/ABC1/UbiB family)